MASPTVPNKQCAESPSRPAAVVRTFRRRSLGALAAFTAVCLLAMVGVEVADHGLNLAACSDPSCRPPFGSWLVGGGCLLVVAGSAVLFWLGVLDPALRTLATQVEHAGRGELQLRGLLETVFRPAAETVHGQLTQLRDSERRAQRLALVASRTTNGVIITDAKGRIEWVNEGFTRLTGYTLAEVVGRRPGEVLHAPETDPRTVAEMQMARQFVRPFRVEVLNRTKDQRLFWNAVHVEPIFDDLKRLVNWIGIENDVTARRQAEDALRHTASRLRALVEHAPQAGVILNAAGVIQYCAEALPQALGHPPAALVGRQINDLVHPDDLPAVMAVVDAALDQPTAPLAVPLCRLRHQDGRWLCFGVRLVSHLDDPDVQGLVAHIWPYRERRTAGAAAPAVTGAERSV